MQEQGVRLASNPNINCLASMVCPNCGEYGPFDIQMLVTLRLYDSGTDDDFEDSTWDGESYCACPNCQHEGLVKDFREDSSC